MFTTLCLRLLSLKGYRLVVTTPVRRSPAHLSASHYWPAACRPCFTRLIITPWSPADAAAVRTPLAPGPKCTGRRFQACLCVVLHSWRAPPHSLTSWQGNKPPEILQIIQSLGPSCDQTIILGWGQQKGDFWGRGGSEVDTCVQMVQTPPRLCFEGLLAVRLEDTLPGCEGWTGQLLAAGP